MSLIRIKGVPPFDGEYEFDVDRSFTTRELRWIKQIAGYLPTSIQSGLDGGDADLVVALTVIAMFREGKISRDDVLAVADRFADEPIGDDEDAFLTVVLAEEVEEELPPEPTLGLVGLSPSSSDEKQNGFGPDSTNILASPDATPSPITDSSSDTSPASVPETSAS